MSNLSILNDQGLDRYNYLQKGGSFLFLNAFGLILSWIYSLNIFVDKKNGFAQLAIFLLKFATPHWTKPAKDYFQAVICRPLALQKGEWLACNPTKGQIIRNSLLYENVYTNSIARYYHISTSIWTMSQNFYR